MNGARCAGTRDPHWDEKTRWKNGNQARAGIHWDGLLLKKGTLIKSLPTEWRWDEEAQGWSDVNNGDEWRQRSPTRFRRWMPSTNGRTAPKLWGLPTMLNSSYYCRVVMKTRAKWRLRYWKYNDNLYRKSCSCMKDEERWSRRWLDREMEDVLDGCWIKSKDCATISNVVVTAMRFRQLWTAERELKLINCRPSWNQHAARQSSRYRSFQLKQTWSISTGCQVKKQTEEDLNRARKDRIGWSCVSCK